MAQTQSRFISAAICLLTLFCLSPRSSPAAFLDVGLGARPVGLGRAFVALADDANAMLYNPAGQARLEQMEIASMYARLYPGIEDDKLHLGYVGVVRPLRSLGAIGLGITNLWADLYHEDVLYLSYARSIRENLAVGVNVKFMRWSAEGYTDPILGLSEDGLSWSGLAFDAGALYTLSGQVVPDFLRAERIQLGLALFNINQPAAADNGADEAKVPLGFEAGVLYQHGQANLLFSYSHRDGKSRLHLGGETELWNQPSPLGQVSMTARAGGLKLLSEDQGGELDFGCGFTLRKVLIDYAFVYPLDLKNVGGCHKISIGYTF